MGGAWQYISGVVGAMATLQHSVDFVAFATRQSLPLMPDHFRAETVLLGLNSRARWRRVVWEHTVLQFLAYRHRLDCMHWFGNSAALFCSVPAVVTVHDLRAAPPSLRTNGPLKQAYLRFMISRTVRTAAVLVPVSNSTAEALCGEFGADRGKMIVVPNLVDERFKPEPREEVERFRQKYHLPREFWLYVAHFYPHKNHLRLVEAYSLLESKGVDAWPLVLRGDYCSTVERSVLSAIQALGLTGKVFWIPRLEVEEMRLLYSAATALVFPSAYEGAGRPVLEAMACGCPVVASDIPAVREHAGEAAAYFDPLQVDSIACAMAEFQRCNLTHEARKRGLQGIVALSSGSVARRLFRAYQAACHQGVDAREGT